MTEPRQLEASATRDGRWWLVRIPELDAVGQARTVRDIFAVAAEVAALHLNVPEEAVDVHVTVHVTEEAERLWEQARQVEEEARAVQQRAAELRREAVRRARADGYKIDAAAAAFGVTPGRIQQLAAEPVAS
jgi:flagellar biosynthesis/type III secretory pathway protein FliH